MVENQKINEKDPEEGNTVEQVEYSSKNEIGKILIDIKQKKELGIHGIRNEALKTHQRLHRRNSRKRKRNTENQILHVEIRKN
ncbi:hypothetical protein HHI36_002535, partial [Cryptolaemus montrouzieri]